MKPMLTIVCGGGHGGDSKPHMSPILCGGRVEVMEVLRTACNRPVVDKA